MTLTLKGKFLLIACVQVITWGLSCMKSLTYDFSNWTCEFVGLFWLTEDIYKLNTLEEQVYNWQYKPDYNDVQTVYVVINQSSTILMRL